MYAIYCKSKFNPTQLSFLNKPYKLSFLILNSFIFSIDRIILFAENIKITHLTNHLPETF